MSYLKDVKIMSSNRYYKYRTTRLFESVYK